MRFFTATVLSLTLASLVSLSAATADPGKSKHKSKAAKQGHSSVELQVDLQVDLGFAKIVISPEERRMVQRYYSAPERSLPPGLAKRRSLPPGLQKHIDKTGHLPPGLEKQALPHDLMHKLPRLDDRYERTIVGNDLILLDHKTGLILDVMQEIFDVPVDASLEKVGARRVLH